MRLSIFTTATKPKERGDLWDETMACYQDLADEVGISGSDWPQEFSWEYIGQQFQQGYLYSSGDWVIRMDLDMLFNENDFNKIRQACEQYDDYPGLCFYKYQFIQPTKYNVKSRLVLALNKGRFGDRIKLNGGGDLCQPTLDGKDMIPSDLPQVDAPVYNYECLLKTKEQVMEDKGRFARAWQKRFGEYKLGGPDDQSAFDAWWKMVSGRYNKDQAELPIELHPKYIQETIRNLKPEHFGHSGWGML